MSVILNQLFLQVVLFVFIDFILSFASIFNMHVIYFQFSMGIKLEICSRKS